jgi:hypothetical protein
MPRSKYPQSFRLSPATFARLDRLRDLRGLSATAAVEAGIGLLAAAMGVEPPAPAPPDADVAKKPHAPPPAKIRERGA